MKTKHITLLILRILVGGMIAYAGIMKLLNIDASIVQFASMGLNSIVFWLVAIGETVAGTALVLGIYSQAAAGATAIIMAGAVYYTGATMVSPILLLLGSVLIMYTGSGKYAVKPCPVSLIDTPPTVTPIVPMTPTPSAPTEPTNPTV